jgi:hypothetical protein
VTLATLVLLAVGTYMLRTAPEVVNCDPGRQSVEIRVTNASADPDTGVVRSEILVCNVWYHDQDHPDAYRAG